MEIDESGNMGKWKLAGVEISESGNSKGDSAKLDSAKVESGENGRILEEELDKGDFITVEIND